MGQKREADGSGSGVSTVSRLVVCCACGDGGVALTMSTGTRSRKTVSQPWWRLLWVIGLVERGLL